VKPPVHQVELWLGPQAGVHAEVLNSARPFGKHWHDSFGFGVMDEGGHRSASGRGPVEARAGHVVTSNPGEVHDGTPLNGASRRWRMVHMAPAAMEQLTGFDGREFSRPVLEDPRLRVSIHRVFRLWDVLRTEDSASARALWEESLTQACGWLVQHHSNRKPGRVRMARLDVVRDCLLDQMDDPPSLGELAGLVGLSRYQLVRQFAAHHGLPPFAWLQQQRLRQACTMMAAGTSLADTAAACGFADQSHLHRHFTRCYGFTPGLWQRARLDRLQ
jgi:AraC-like DNA-binding protein